MAKSLIILPILKKPSKEAPVIHQVVRDSDKFNITSSTNLTEAKKAHLVIRDGKLPVREPKGRYSPGQRRKCLCGCNGETLSFFVRGHVRRLQAVLRDIARGESVPDECLTPELVAHLGPWKPEGKGLVPTHGYVSFYDR